MSTTVSIGSYRKKGGHMSNYAVSQNCEGDWETKKDGTHRSSGNFPTQKAAEIRAKELAGNTGGGEV